MLTEDTGSVSISPNGSVKEMAINPDIEIPELCKLDFKRCPYCGDPLDKYMKCHIEVELDTLHYYDKSL